MKDRCLVILGVLFTLACNPETPAPANDTAATTVQTTTTSEPPAATASLHREGPPLRHYRLWNIRPHEIQPGHPFPQTIRVMDRLSGGSWWEARVIKPGLNEKHDLAYLANPVKKTHGAVTASYDQGDPHYVMYVLRSDHAAPASAKVRNQFTNGEETWELRNEFRMLAPAAKTLDAAPGAPPPADHFVCFGVQDVAQVNAKITLTDQFEGKIKQDDSDEPVTLTPLYVCAAASKQHTGPDILAKNPDDRLAIYKLSRYATARRPPAWAVRTRDQFTALRFEVDRGELLAVPQDPNPAPQ